MKNLFSTLLLVLFFNHSFSFAADGEIKFVGSIIPTACSVDSDSIKKVVNMGKILTAAFTSKYSMASTTPFKIKLSNCPSDYKRIQFKFDGQGDSSNPTLLALSSNSSSTPATGVAIALYEENNVRPIAINGASRFKDIAKNNSVEMKFIAKYIATADKVTPGSADALTHFSVIYE